VGVGEGVFGVGYFAEGKKFGFVGFGIGSEAVDIVGCAVEGSAELFHYFNADFVVLAGGNSVCEIETYAMFGEEFSFFFDVSCPK
jgi:hypothetical protein